MNEFQRDIKNYFKYSFIGLFVMTCLAVVIFAFGFLVSLFFSAHSRHIGYEIFSWAFTLFFLFMTTSPIFYVFGKTAGCEIAREILYAIRRR